MPVKISLAVPECKKIKTLSDLKILHKNQQFPHEHRTNSNTWEIFDTRFGCQLDSLFPF